MSEEIKKLIIDSGLTEPGLTILVTKLDRYISEKVEQAAGFFLLEDFFEIIEPLCSYQDEELACWAEYREGYLQPRCQQENCYFAKNTAILFKQGLRKAFLE